MKGNRLDDVLFKDKNLSAEKMKDYFIYVGKNITDSITQEGKNSFSLVKSLSRITFYFHVDSIQIFKFLKCLSEENIEHDVIYAAV